MTLSVYIRTESATVHERRDIRQLLRMMDTWFADSPNPYALFINPVVHGKDLDLLALTSRAIVVIDLKDVGRPGGIIEGFENGPWSVHFSDGETHELTPDDSNPYLQVKGYRRTLINWLNEFADRVFGSERLERLRLDRVNACLAICPSLDRSGSTETIRRLGRDVLRWFDAIGLDHLCEKLHDTITPDLDLFDHEMKAFAKCLGLRLCTNIGPLTLTGPLTIPRPHILRQPPPARSFLDREDDILTLLLALDDPDWSVLSISGPAGIGKTFLASRLCELVADQRPVHWISCGQPPDVSLERLLLAVAKLVETQSPPTAQYIADPYREESVRIRLALEHLEKNRACLVLDDYHIVEEIPGLDRFVRQFDNVCREAKLILTTRRRPDFVRHSLDKVQGYLPHRLKGLPQQYVRPYLNPHPALRRRLTESDCAAIWQKTGGNPRLMDIVVSVSGGKSLTEVDVPDDLNSEDQAESYYENLLSHVDKEARALVHAASVLRGPISVDLLKALCRPTIDDTACIRELEDTFVLRYNPDAQEYTIDSFVRELLYDRLRPETRMRYHRTVARHLLEDETVHAQPDEALFHAYQAQAWRLLLRHAPQALELLDDSLQWEPAVSISAWSLEAAESIGDRTQICRWSLALARHLRHAGHFDDARVNCNRGRELAEQLASPELRAAAFHELGMLAQRRREYDRAGEWHLKALELNRCENDKNRIARSLGKLGDIARIQKRTADALQYYQESVSLSEETGNRQALAINYTQMGTLEKYEGSLERSRQHFVLALDNAERCNQSRSRLIALGQLAEVTGRLGDFGEALRLIDEALALEGQIHSEMDFRITTGIKVDLLIMAGHTHAASEQLAALQAKAPDDDRFGVAFNLKRQGLIAILSGDIVAGTRQLREAIATFEDSGRTDWADDCGRALDWAVQRPAAGRNTSTANAAQKTEQKA